METTPTLPLASVEPHRFLLRQPEAGALLFKIVRVHNLIDMLQKGYLHFQRVDTYSDDTADGEQLPLDRTTGADMSFTKDPQFTAERYYDTSRARTYACCFSLEHSAYLWENYAPHRDAVCLVFDFEKLRQRLNATLQASIDNDGLLLLGADTIRPIFSINYGIVEYVDRQTHALHPTGMANPIHFTYLKEKARYADDRELRVTLSALGVGQFALASGTIMEFPSALQMGFDFRSAFAAGAITEIRCLRQFVSASNLEALRNAMLQLGIMTTEADVPPPGSS